MSRSASILPDSHLNTCIYSSLITNTNTVILKYYNCVNVNNLPLLLAQQLQLALLLAQLLQGAMSERKVGARLIRNSTIINHGEAGESLTPW